MFSQCHFQGKVGGQGKVQINKKNIEVVVVVLEDKVQLNRFISNIKMVKDSFFY